MKLIFTFRRPGLRRGSMHIAKNERVQEYAFQGCGQIEAGRGNGGIWKARKTMVLFFALPTYLGNR